MGDGVGRIESRHVNTCVCVCVCVCEAGNSSDRFFWVVPWGTLMSDANNDVMEA